MRWACLLLPHLALDAVLRGQPAHDPKASERCRRLLASWAYRFSSQVSTALPDAIVLEIGQSRALFGEWPQVQARLRTGLGDVGFRYRLAAAPSPHAAWALARGNDGIGVDDAVLVRALGQLAVECAGLDDDSTRALRRMGLAKLRQVFALPRDTLARRFPASVLARLDIMRGGLAPPLPCYRPPDRFDGRIEFEQEVESNQALRFPLRR